MLDLISKLINEHGSSEILKQRLELINERYEELERKLESSKNECELLKGENEDLTEKASNLENQLDALKSFDEKINEEQEDILKLLLNVEFKRDYEIGQELDLDKGLLDYHISELSGKELIKYHHGTILINQTNHPKWKITQEGRKYLIEGGM